MIYPPKGIPKNHEFLVNLKKLCEELLKIAIIILILNMKSNKIINDKIN